MGSREHRNPKRLVPNPITVSRCRVQTAKDRFGDDGHKAVLLRDGAMRRTVADYPFTYRGQDNWPYYALDPEFEGPDLPESSIWKRVPTMQQYRNNLTALSQDFNLYFVAYRNRIFVYRPTSIARQRLHEHPELQLLARVTQQGVLRGGYIEPQMPQTINAIKVGHLGDQEILVAVCDNGDVSIWMTMLVAREAIARRRAKKGADPHYVSDSNMTSRGDVPAFHTTHVGLSTWGIDIHRQSRLIAVSSNNPVVTVIALGLRNDEYFTSRHKAKCRLPLRDHTCQINMSLGRGAQNIPNVCFLDDLDGDAEKVCAQDIGGNTWIASIWKPCGPAYRIPHSASLDYMRSEEFYPNRPRGWGVIVLPESSFMEVKHSSQLIGLDLPNTAPSLPGEKHPNQQRLLQFGAAWLDLPEYPARSPAPGELATVNAFLGSLGTANFHGFSDGLAAAGLDSEDDDEDQDYHDEEVEDTDEEEFTASEDEMDDQLVDAIAQAYAANGLPWGTDTSLSGNGMEDDDSEDETATQMQHEASARRDWKGEAAAASAQNQNLDEADRGPLHAEESLFVPWNPFPEPKVEELPQKEGAKKIPFKSMPVGNIKCNETTGEMTCEWYLDPKLQGEVKGPQLKAEDPRKRVQILRTYEDSIEMRCLNENRTSYVAEHRDDHSGLSLDRPEIYNSRREKEVGLVCDKLMPLGLFRRPRWEAAFEATGRLNMMFHVPELQLVVIGSPTGRVALVTPTKLTERLPAGRTKAFWQHGFHVEMVLPRKSEEEQFSRTPCPLHGIAVAPLQQSTKLRVTDPDRRRHEQIFRTKFRLVLHYRDHSIWTYILSRRDTQARDMTIL